MKTKELSRGEILLGMEQGIYKTGDMFKDVSEKGHGSIAHIVGDEDGETALYWKKEERVVQLRNCLTEKWDLVEEPKFKIGDWAVFDGNVCKVTDIPNDDEFTVDKIGRLKNQWITKKYIERKATPEEITREKRRRVFANVGREVDEFKCDDIIHCGDKVLMVVTGFDEHDNDLILCQWWDEENQRFRTSVWNKTRLIPIYFVEHIVHED
ncbi:hypothetical protein [Bacillus mycoides]|uniref:hypothetical protein n=1 Tax=Bacillus mycoides TaxID=1405 RepID=UPI001C00BBB4|nr:hypothetical protein [Bacillus mycoides]QWH09558.1 hypothetical protein EXW49_27835 [Bacillus mycoides]